MGFGFGDAAVFGSAVDTGAGFAAGFGLAADFDAAGFAGSETREIVLKFPSRTIEFTGLNYLTGFAIPNLFFHVTTAYAILRHSGAPLGKTDFLGG